MYTHTLARTFPCHILTTYFITMGFTGTHEKEALMTFSFDVRASLKQLLLEITPENYQFIFTEEDK